MQNKWWISGLAACAFVVAAVFWFDGIQKVEEMPPIRIATSPWPGYEFLYLAEKKGFFKEEGVNIKLIRFSALEDIWHAFVRRQTDGMASTLIELLQARENGRAAKIVLVTDFSNGADFILARKEVRDMAGLKGKKVAVEAGSLGVFMLARALEKSGLTQSDVQTVGLDQLNMPKALLSGKVDAIVTYPPTSIELTRQGDNVVKIFDSSQIPGEVVDVVSFSVDITTHRSKDIAAFLRAWHKALAYTAAQPEEAYRILAEYQGISPEEFKESLDGVRMVGLTEQKNMLSRAGPVEKTIMKVHKVLSRNGHLKQSINPGDFLMNVPESQ